MDRMDIASTPSKSSDLFVIVFPFGVKDDSEATHVTTLRKKDRGLRRSFGHKPAIAKPSSPRMDLGCGPGGQLDHMDSGSQGCPGGQRAAVSGDRMRQDATVRPGLVRPIRWQGAAQVGFLLWQVAALAGASAAGPGIDVLVVDPSNRPVANARVQLKAGQSVVASAETDQNGHAGFAELKPAIYAVTAIKDGFEPAQKADLNLSQGGSADVELTLVPTLARQESIEVKGTVAPVAQGASPSNELPTESAKELPGRPATVADALPLVPGVVRSPGGGLVISSAGEHRSALIVNSADVTDPATGQFGLTVPIDSVETLNVYQTPFLAEYGRFTAGLVSVETRRGGDKWKWELNEPLNRKSG